MTKNRVSADHQADQFRHYLQAELLERCKNNPRYSLRALARSLSTDPSSLSQVLRGKRKLSEKKMALFFLKLGRSVDEVSKFTKAGIEKVPLELEPDQFRLISEWYHFAIFEIVKIQSLEHSYNVFATTLGISAAEAKDAVERLIRLGILEQRGGRWHQKVKTITTTSSDFSTVALRLFQKQLLINAEIAMDQVPFNERDQSSITLAMSSKKIVLAKKMIKDFRRRLMQILESEDSPDAVYNLVISFFPATKMKRGR